MRRVFLALLCAGANACATMDETGCRYAKWDELGQADGLAGGQPRIDQYAYQCSQHQATADEKTYMEGWREGNVEYRTRVPGPASGD